MTLVAMEKESDPFSPVSALAGAGAAYQGDGVSFMTLVAKEKGSDPFSPPERVRFVDGSGEDAFAGQISNALHEVGGSIEGICSVCMCQLRQQLVLTKGCYAIRR